MQRFLAALLMFAAVVPAASAFPWTDGGKMAPRHDPIVIDEYSDLLLPEDLSGNGVRRGTGLEADPFVIENWDILATEDHGVRIKDVDAHILLKDLVIHAVPGTFNTGIVLDKSPNVRIENLVVRDMFNGIFASRSNLSIAGARFEGLTGTLKRDINDPFGTLRPWGEEALAIYTSSVARGSMERVEIRDSEAGISWGGRSGRFVDILVTNVTGPAFGLGGEDLELERVTLRGRNDEGQRECDRYGSRGGTTTGLRIRPHTATGIARLKDVDISGFDFGVVTGLVVDAPMPAGTLQADGLRVSKSSCAVTLTYPGVDTEFRRAALVGNNVGLSMALEGDGVASSIMIEESRIAENRIGIFVGHQGPQDSGLDRNPSAVFRGNDIVNNREFAIRYDDRDRPHAFPSDFVILADDNYWGGGRPPVGKKADSPNTVSNQVQVSTWLEESQTGYVAPPSGSTTSALSFWVALASMLASFGLRRRQ